jgi:hypothetical protein
MQTFAQKQNQPQKPESSGPARSAIAAPEPNHLEQPSLHLQRTIGNRAVQRMLQTHAEASDAASTAQASSRFGHDFSRIPIQPPSAAVIQTKPAINKPGDEYEQEAERMAEQVLRMPDSMLQRDKPEVGVNKLQTALLSRSVAPINSRRQPDEEKLLQAKTVSEESPSLNSDLEERMSNLRGGGRPLSSASRNYFEPRFGYDFNQVRIHTDDGAAGLARAVNARAFTLGHDVVFASGQYAPEQDEGKKLLAHELTHVIQQNQSNHLEGSGRRLLNANRQIHREWALPETDLPEEYLDSGELTDAQVEAAIRFNRLRYNETSTRRIQDVVGVEQTGRWNAETVRNVARFQRHGGLTADGKLGQDSYDLLMRELVAEGATGDNAGESIQMFEINGPRPLTFFRQSNPTQGTIQSRFDIKILFDPRVHPEQFEYRQYIKGTISETYPDGHVDNDLGRLLGFLPEGRLKTTFQEDGDTSTAAGLAGHNYGHRNARPNDSTGQDVYSDPDRPTGTHYSGFDVPEIGPFPISAAAGHTITFDLEFLGQIIRRQPGNPTQIIQGRGWRVTGSVVIPTS